jgi:acyl-CoA synthetase (AMP-forming)/AMP-acid ligase II
VNVAELLRKAARTHGERPALTQGGRSFRYSELDEWVGRVAGGLVDQGLSRGDRVVLWAQNQPELVTGLLATLRGGFVAVPINARLHPSEVSYIRDNSQASAIVFDRELTSQQPGWLETLPSDVLRVPVEALPESSAPLDVVEATTADDAWLFYTSGTTGRPKGAVLTHGNLVAMTMNCLADVYSFRPEDVVLHAAPLTHGSGLFMLPSLARGAHNLLTERGHFDPAAVFRLVATELVTAIAFLAPTQIVALMNHPGAAAADLSSLRAVIYGGGPMYVEHIRRALELWGPIFVQLYGQGETPMTGTYLRPEDHLGEGSEQARRLGSVGIPRTDVELRIFDAEDHPLPAGEIGEIVIRAATVMKGYWLNPEATAQTLRNGWLHTGDLAYEDPDGYVHLVDRAKDMIISGGNNVYAREVEEAILTHPQVAEAAVVGVPDDYWGEAVVAFVVPVKPGLVGATDVIEHCRERLASYKKPKSVIFVTELPKNAYGKVLKRELRQRLKAPGGAN